MESGKSSSFSLNKLYLDCIDEKGNCFVIHQFRLEIRFMKFSWSGLLYSDTAGVTHEITSSKKTEDTILRDLLIFFNHHLDIKGSWNRIDPPLPAISFDDPASGEFSWDCHHPKSETEVVFGEKSYYGPGFVESFNLSMSPVDLHIDDLRSGHFLSSEHTIVWLKWNGKYPVNKLWHNGIEYNDPVYEEDGIVFGAGKYKLSFTRKVVIRRASLSEILEDLPVIRFIYRKQISGTMETRYKAVSELTDGHDPVAKGWSIFENVVRKQ